MLKYTINHSVNPPSIIKAKAPTKIKSTLPYTLQVKAKGSVLSWSRTSYPLRKALITLFRGEMSERIRHARTMPERKETRTLREKRESRRTNRSKKTNAPLGCVCLFGAGERARNRHTATGIKTHILTQKTPKIRRFCVIFYSCRKCL